MKRRDLDRIAWAADRWHSDRAVRDVLSFYLVLALIFVGVSVLSR